MPWLMIADGVEPAHILLLQEIDGIAVPLGKQCDQNIGACHRILAGRLYMQDGTLDNPLKTGRGGGIALFFGFERLIFLIEILLNHIAQISQIDTAGLHDLGGVGIVDQSKQQMFQRRIFMAAVGRMGLSAECNVFSRLCAKLGISCFFRC